MSCYSREQIQETMAVKGYKYFAGDGDYDVNIIGVRNSETKNRVTNAFDDCMTLSYKVDGEWHFHCYKCTTDPGTHWMANLLNEKGVAILKPGQYRGAYKIRKHQGKYDALCQRAPVKVYRDKNKDHVYDLTEDHVHEGIFGINIHRATAKKGGKSWRVDKWSAGCQVIASNDDWREFLGVCRKAAGIWGNKFTYTLIESNDIV